MTQISGLILYAAVLSLGLAVLLAPLLVQLVNPVLSATGAHRYHSRFLYTVEKECLHLHLGNSFDILWKMGRASRREVHREILAGLRNLCATVPPSARITLCTWFLSPRKMRRLGFTQEQASVAEKLDLAGGYLEILFQQFLLTRRLRFFNPFTASRYSIQVAVLQASGELGSALPGPQRERISDA